MAQRIHKGAKQDTAGVKPSASAGWATLTRAEPVAPREDLCHHESATSATIQQRHDLRHRPSRIRRARYRRTVPGALTFSVGCNESAAGRCNTRSGRYFGTRANRHQFMRSTSTCLEKSHSRGSPCACDMLIEHVARYVEVSGTSMSRTDATQLRGIFEGDSSDRIVEWCRSGLS